MDNWYSFTCPCGDTLVGKIGESLESKCEKCGAVFKVEFQIRIPEESYDGFCVMNLNDVETFSSTDRLTVYAFEYQDGSEQCFINLNAKKAEEYATKNGLRLTVAEFKSRGGFRLIRTQPGQ